MIVSCGFYVLSAFKTPFCDSKFLCSGYVVVGCVFSFGCMKIFSKMSQLVGIVPFNGKIDFFFNLEIETKMYFDSAKVFQVVDGTIPDTESA